MMRRLRDLWFRVRTLLAWSRMEEELDEELAFHLEMETRKLVEAGLEPEAARRQALLSFGGRERFREEARRAWGVDAVRDVGSDLRFAVRQLRKHPAFSVLAALTLSLGIGGTVALFSVVHGLLVRSLPVPAEDEVRVFYHEYNWRGVEFDYVKERVEVWESLAAYSTDAVTLRTDRGSSLLLATMASAELFDVMGVPALLGRGLREGDDRPGAEPVVVLSHGLWTQEFGGDPEVVGRTLTLGGVPTTVAGVMPEGVYFPTPETRAWLPLDLDPDDGAYHGNGWLVLAGRLGDGVSPGQMEADLERMAAALGERFEYSEAWDKSRDPYVVPLREYVLGDVRPVLLLLLGAVGLVLLMACANVAALILTRTADRTGEMSVRAALGAGRVRLARQILTESVVLGVGAGVVGVGLAVALFDLLVASLPLPAGFGATLSMEWGALVGGMVLAVVTGGLVSLAPMRSLLAGALPGSLPGAGLGRRASSGGPGGRRGMQRALVVAEVLLAVVLATGAGLLVRTVGELRGIDPGLDPEGVLSVDVLLPARELSPDERVDYVRRLVERARALPGVEAAGLVNRAPIRDGGYQAVLTLEGRPDLTGERGVSAYYRPVTPGAFDALGVQVVRGRGIRLSDRAGARRVAVVNETFARRIWGSEDEALGRLILDNGFTDEPTEVVGVVRNVAVQGLVGEVPMAAYYPWDQAVSDPQYVILTLKTAPDATGVAGPVRALVTELDPRAAVARVTTMAEIVDEAMAEPLRLRLYLGLFSVLGIVLGTVGVYGVVSYGVRRRRVEFGIRMALGARPSRLLAEVVRTGMVPVLAGVASGVVVALAGSSLLARFLFGVEPTDPVSFLASAGVLLLAGGLAALVPAWRAGSTDPAAALRAE